jgi:malonyl-CoA/methylmalonyl-CoA synthetase
MSFYHQLTQSWRDHRAAIASAAGVTTYGQLRERVARGRGWLLARGVRPGDVVGLQLPKGNDLLDLHLACLSLGAVSLVLSERYTAREIRWFLEDSGAALSCVTDATAAALEDLATPLHAASDLRVQSATAAAPPATPPDDALALLCYTSGTTGRPKGVCLTQGNLAATVRALHQAWRWSYHDVLVHALPQDHIHGLVVAQHGALWAGALTIWMERFDPAEALQTLDARNATVFMGVPTFYHRFLQLPPNPAVDLSSMRLFTSGSAPLPAEDHRAFRRRFGHAILERYGMTEVGIALSNPYDGERRPGAVGFPIPGIEAQIVDAEGREVPIGEIGELRVSGPSVFVGYLGRPEHTDRVLVDGWMHTGDLVRRDAEGYLHIVGRRTDLIITGGHNVHPGEVEEVLQRHPSVADAAVVGVPDPDLGERVVASLVGHPPPEDLLVWVREQLISHKCPRAIEWVEALPRNAMGKVQKHLLRDAWSLPRVRPARPSEAAHIATWNRRMAQETEGEVLDPEVARSGTHAVFEGEVGAFYLRAEIAGVPVGQCMVTTEWSDWRNRLVWWIQSVYVAPEWRRRGVYRALHEAVLDRARSAGAAGVRLYVDRSNDRAAHVYRRVGMDGDHYLVFEQMFGPSVGDPDSDGP